jgi:hypothetical protein
MVEGCRPAEPRVDEHRPAVTRLGERQLTETCSRARMVVVERPLSETSVVERRRYARGRPAPP